MIGPLRSPNLQISLMRISAVPTLILFKMSYCNMFRGMPDISNSDWPFQLILLIIRLYFAPHYLISIIFHSFFSLFFNLFYTRFIFYAHFLLSQPKPKRSSLNIYMKHNSNNKMEVRQGSSI